MEKKAKVTKITKYEKKDSYGNTSFSITFDNGDSGYYTSKKEEQTIFVINQEAIYNLEEKTSGAGKTYFKVTVPQSEKPAFGKPQQDPKTQMISFAMSYTKDLVNGGKIQMNDLEKEFNRIYTLMTSKL